jgi:hypothetical protein
LLARPDQRLAAGDTARTDGERSSPATGSLKAPNVQGATSAGAEAAVLSTAGLLALAPVADRPVATTHQPVTALPDVPPDSPD